MVIRMRSTHSHTGNRRSHHAIAADRTSKCVCGALRQPHKACPECGMYNGRVVVDVVAKAERAAKRAKRHHTIDKTETNVEKTPSDK